MQDSHSERRLRGHVYVRGGLPVSLRSVVVHRPRVRVDVCVLVPVVPVLVHVDALPGRLTDSPRSDPDEHQPDEPLAPVGQPFHGEDFAKEKRRDSHDDDSSRVTQSPQEAGPPRTVFAISGQGRDGRQVIGPRQDVNCARGQAPDDGSYHGVPEVSAAGGGPYTEGTGRRSLAEVSSLVARSTRPPCWA